MNLEQNVMNYDNKRKLIMRAPFSRNRTFKIRIQIGESHSVVVIGEDQNSLWHQRFGHPNFRSLSLLNMKGMVHGFPSL